jgi:hypothetical protein
MEYIKLPYSIEEFLKQFAIYTDSKHLLIFQPPLGYKINLVENLYHFAEYPVLLTVLKCGIRGFHTLVISCPFLMEHEWEDLYSDCRLLGLAQVDIRTYLFHEIMDQDYFIIQPESLNDEWELDLQQVVWDLVKLSVQNQLKEIAA